MTIVCRILLLIALLYCIPLKAQNIILKKIPRVKTSIKIINPSGNADSIKIVITLLNECKGSQKVYLLENALSGSIKDSLNSPFKALLKSQISATLYTEKQLDSAGKANILNKGESLSREFYLTRLFVFLNDNQKITSGKYSVKISYFGNTSNKAFFYPK
ncbi:hypothetical protein EOD41_09550 [Mucilaginibacter limnophilus]|uniref:Uncharacterized protein n=1 Tax=Mucilaginibacter limnophilus TaxID=1932778 RepID=A0A3S2Y0X3_9SPHI|nr:hypothetical protein [Mucilaginibacter limnophilus]RVU00871.1 hypothetical protein EOD41_09550 [Mucilaginibacter limnophilus]